MMLKIWAHDVLLFCGVFFTAAGAFVGKNIGTDVSSLPSADGIVRILRAQQITHVCLFDTDSHMLNALSTTGIEVMVSVTNEEVLGVGEIVAAYVPSTNITAIAVGSEVLTSLPHAAPILLPAISDLYTALVASDLNYRVTVLTPHSMDMIPQPFPPCTAAFNATLNFTVFQILEKHKVLLYVECIS